MSSAAAVSESEREEREERRDKEGREREKREEKENTKREPLTHRFFFSLSSLFRPFPPFPSVFTHTCCDASDHAVTAVRSARFTSIARRSAKEKERERGEKEKRQSEECTVTPFGLSDFAFFSVLSD